MYKLKGNLKDGVYFSFDKLKHVKFGEIGLVDIYIPEDDEASTEITFSFYNNDHPINISLNDSLDIQKDIIYKVKNILEEERKSWMPEYKVYLDNLDDRVDISIDFDKKNGKVFEKIIDVIKSKHKQYYVITKKLEKISLDPVGYDNINLKQGLTIEEINRLLEAIIKEEKKI